MSPLPERMNPLVNGVVVAGLILTVIAAVTLRARTLDSHEHWLADRAEVIRSSLVESVDGLSDGLEAIAAYIEVTGSVDQQGFNDFTARVDRDLGLIGVAYMDIVPASELNGYESRQREIYPDYEVVELDLAGSATPALGDRATYYPVQFFAAGEMLTSVIPEGDRAPLDLSRGVDGGSDPEWRVALETAIADGESIVSDFITTDIAGVPLGDSFLIAVPVYDASETVVGVLAAPMLNALLSTQLDAAIFDGVSWSVDSVSPEFVPERTAALWSDGIQFPGATWMIDVRPNSSNSANADTTGNLVLLIGFILTGAIAKMISLALQRSASRARIQKMQQIAVEKDRFLAAVSHELRTPLTSVAGFAHELNDRPSDFSAGEAREIIGLIAGQSDEVTAIVEDLLVAARSDIESINVLSEQVDVIQEAEAALIVSQIAAEIRPGPRAIAWADPKRVRQILRNLLTNAGRYGGPKVRISCVAVEDHVMVLVQDNGKPLPESQREHIFQPYVSAHGSAAAVGSIGLGLFISRNLARLMGGDLAYRYEEGWASFVLMLPKPPYVGPGAVSDDDLARRRQSHSNVSVFRTPGDRDADRPAVPAAFGAAS